MTLLFNVRVIRTCIVSCLNADARSHQNAIQIPLLIGATLDEYIHIESVLCGVFVVGALGKDRDLSRPYFMILVNDGSVGNVASRTTDIAELPIPYRNGLIRFEVITAAIGHAHTDRPNPILPSVHRRIHGCQRGQNRGILDHFNRGINDMVERLGINDGLAVRMHAEYSSGRSAQRDDQ